MQHECGLGYSVQRPVQKSCNDKKAAIRCCQTTSGGSKRFRNFMQAPSKECLVFSEPSLFSIMLWREERQSETAARDMTPHRGSSGRLCYLGQGSEARVRLRAPANHLHSLLVVSNKATVQTELVDLHSRTVESVLFYSTAAGEEHTEAAGTALSALQAQVFYRLPLRVEQLEQVVLFSIINYTCALPAAPTLCFNFLVLYI